MILCNLKWYIILTKIQCLLIYISHHLPPNSFLETCFIIYFTVFAENYWTKTIGYMLFCRWHRTDFQSSLASDDQRSKISRKKERPFRNFVKISINFHKQSQFVPLTVAYRTRAVHDGQICIPLSGIRYVQTLDIKEWAKSIWGIPAANGVQVSNSPFETLSNS